MLLMQREYDVIYRKIPVSLVQAIEPFSDLGFHKGHKVISQLLEEAIIRLLGNGDSLSAVKP